MMIITPPPPPPRPILKAEFVLSGAHGSVNRFDNLAQAQANPTVAPQESQCLEERPRELSVCLGS